MGCRCQRLYAVSLNLFMNRLWLSTVALRHVSLSQPLGPLSANLYVGDLSPTRYID